MFATEFVIYWSVAIFGLTVLLYLFVIVPWIDCDYDMACSYSLALFLFLSFLDQSDV